MSASRTPARTQARCEILMRMLRNVWTEAGWLLFQFMEFN